MKNYFIASHVYLGVLAKLNNCVIQLIKLLPIQRSINANKNECIYLFYFGNSY